MTLPTSTIDRDAIRLEPRTLAAYLQDELAESRAAYLLGIPKDELAQLTTGETVPQWDSMLDRRLRAGYAAVRVIVDEYDATTVLSWLFGMNPYFDDCAPVDMMQLATTEEQLNDVLVAARQFAHSAW